MVKPGNGRSEQYILALDMGTSFLHCLAADVLGRPAAEASLPVLFYKPEGCPSLAREFNPHQVLEDLGKLISKTLKMAGLRASDIIAIAITSQRQGVVFLDNEGKEIYCGPNIDLRAVFEGARIDEELGSEIYDTTGHCPSMLMTPARLSWFRNNRALIYNKTHTVVSIASWLAYRLSGHLVSEECLEGEAGLLDITSRARCTALFKKLDISPDLFPGLYCAGAPAGILLQTMAERWGLDDGIPIYVAGPDTQCGLLGMGRIEVGQVAAVMGWSGALQVVSSRPCLDESAGNWVGCYPLNGMWVGEINLGDTGNAYRWLKDILLGTDAPFDEADQLALHARAASEGVTAFLGPAPVSSIRAGLKMGGLLFPTPFIFQETDRGQLLRAALENIAYSVKANLATLTKVTDVDSSELYLGGGMASSRSLAKTLADVLGIPVRRITTTQVSARGAAILAGTAPSNFQNLREAAQAAIQDCEEVEPGSTSDMAQYEECYQQWLSLYERLDWVKD